MDRPGRRRDVRLPQARTDPPKGPRRAAAKHARALRRRPPSPPDAFPARRRGRAPSAGLGSGDPDLPGDGSTEGWRWCVAAPPRTRSDGGALGGRVGPPSGDVGAEPAGHGDAKTSQQGVAAAPRWSRRRRRRLGAGDVGRSRRVGMADGRPWTRLCVEVCWGGPAPAVVDLRPPNIGTWSLRRGVIPIGLPGSRLRGLLHLDQ